jgi:ABC-2 type transport system permease protein
MPLAQILLFGYAVTNEIREARIGIFDLSRDSETRKIENRLLASGYFQLTEHWGSWEELEAGFRSGRVKMGIVFPEHFAEHLQTEGRAQVQIITDASDPNTAQSLLAYASAILTQYQQESQPLAELPFQIGIESRMRYNPELKGVYLFVPGLIAIILMLISALMTSVSIAREKETGTMEVLLVSPMRPLQIVFAKVTPYMLLGMLIASTVLLVGRFVFGVPIEGSLLLLMGEGLLFILASLALGVLISTVAPDQQVALMMSLMGLMLPTILLSGFMFPIDNMPRILQIISHAIPARWFIVIIKNILLKGEGLALIWPETLILLGFTLFLLLLSARRFKVRLE